MKNTGNKKEYRKLLTILLQLRRLNALALINDCYKLRIYLLTDNAIIESLIFLMTVIYTVVRYLHYASSRFLADRFPAFAVTITYPFLDIMLFVPSIVILIRL
jgi:hypothetical protein